MKTTGLTKRLLLLVLSISILCPLVSSIILYRNSIAAQEYQKIAESVMPTSLLMKEVLIKFREIRIQVRSIPLAGNTLEDREKFYQATVAAIEDFLKSKDALILVMHDSGVDRKMLLDIEEKWKIFYTFGGELLELVKKNDEASILMVGKLVRERCPPLAIDFDLSIRKLITWQEQKGNQMVSGARNNAKRTFIISVVLIFAGIIFALLVGGVMAQRLSKNISINTVMLTESIDEIKENIKDMTKVSSALSTSVDSQSMHLQQNASSVSQITAMVAQNRDGAFHAAETSQSSLEAVERGKQTISAMAAAIKEMASANERMVEELQESNSEIQNITHLIDDISKRTQIINDIVFQTKLLSFNASIEAARAGEHGKGFAVVAEEVGNLASMSGKAASEISNMLAESVKQVDNIIKSSNILLQDIVVSSQERMSKGIKLTNDCTYALDKIHAGVDSVDIALNNIKVATNEQAQGIEELNRAMHALDEVTRLNSSSAVKASQSASNVEVQVEKMSTVVHSLLEIIEGKVQKERVSNSEKKIIFPDKEPKQIRKSA